MNDIRVTPQPWLRMPRVKPIRFIEIHATRGKTTPEKQKGAALNWVQSPDNVGGRDASGNPEWGSSFSHVIGTDGSKGTVLDDDQMPTYSAGYGGVGSTYAIDEYGISFELAQSQAQEPFTDALYGRLAEEVAPLCLKYGIPPTMISVTNQRGTVPTGIVRHDRCENGIKLGKTDPGVQFNEVRFIADVKAKMQPPQEDEMTQDEFNVMFAEAVRTVVYKPRNADGAVGATSRTAANWALQTREDKQALTQHKNEPHAGGYTDAEAVKAVREKL